MHKMPEPNTLGLFILFLKQAQELKWISAACPQTPTTGASAHNDIEVDPRAEPGVVQATGLHVMKAQVVSWVEIQIDGHTVFISQTLVQTLLHGETWLGHPAWSTCFIDSGEWRRATLRKQRYQWDKKINAIWPVIMCRSFFMNFAALAVNDRNS